MKITDLEYFSIYPYIKQQKTINKKIKKIEFSKKANILCPKTIPDIFHDHSNSLLFQVGGTLLIKLQ